MLPNVAAMFDRMTAEMVRVRILYSLATSRSIAWPSTMNQRFAIVDGFLNCPLDSSVEIRKNAPIGVIRSISRTFKMQNAITLGHWPISSNGRIAARPVWTGPVLPGEPDKRPQAATSGHKRPTLPGEPIA